MAYCGCKMKVALFQYDIKWEDKSVNKDRINLILDEYTGEAPEWIIFPEMSLSAFSMNPEKTRLIDDDFDFFRRIAKSKRCFISFGGIKDLKNTVFTIDSTGNLINEYSKLHLFSYGNETSSYKAGSEEFALEHRSFILKDLKIVPAICYDLRFAYMFWDYAPKTDLYFVIANWPASRREHWMTLLKARAIENQAYFIGVNRVGRDKDLQYSGDSLIIDPFGREVLNCSSNEGLFVADLDIEIMKTVREKFPFIKDRRR
jgi:omega-amidase